MTQETKHTPLPWAIKGKDGKYLGPKNKWEARYDGKAPVITYLPIMKGNQTVALVVSKCLEWPNTEAEDNAIFIHKAVNNHEKLLDMVKDTVIKLTYYAPSSERNIIKEATALIKEIEGE